MSFEAFILRWALWSLIFAITIGGKPWHFPEAGKLIFRQGQEGLFSSR